MEDQYIHEQHGVHNILFCPKRRKKGLVGPVRDRLQELIQQVAEEQKWQIVELAIQPDRMHLFIQTNPYALPTDIVRRIKERSSHHLREEFPHLLKLPSLWTRSAFYAAVGFVSQDTIQKYIERQGKSSC